MSVYSGEHSFSTKLDLEIELLSSMHENVNKTSAPTSGEEDGCNIRV